MSYVFAGQVLEETHHILLTLHCRIAPVPHTRRLESYVSTLWPPSFFIWGVPLPFGEVSFNTLNYLLSHTNTMSTERESRLHLGKRKVRVDHDDGIMSQGSKKEPSDWVLDKNLDWFLAGLAKADAQRAEDQLQESHRRRVQKETGTFLTSRRWPCLIIISLR